MSQHRDDPISDEEEGEVVESVQPRKRGPVEEKSGQSSVMPETLATARSAGASFTNFASDVGEASGTVLAHEVHSRGASMNLAPGTKVSSEDAAKHSRVVSQGGAIGKQAGAQAGAGVTAILLQLAARIGAHQCDSCNAKKLYNYWTCLDAQYRTKDGSPFDLCEACFKRHSTSKLSSSFPPASQFIFHNNSEYTLKLLGVVVLTLILLKWILGRIF